MEPGSGSHSAVRFAAPLKPVCRRTIGERAAAATRTRVAGPGAIGTILGSRCQRVRLMDQETGRPCAYRSLGES